MFDEDRPALESDQERSARHARMVAAAFGSTILYTAFMTGLTALMMLTPLLVFDVNALFAVAGLCIIVWGGYAAWSTWRSW